MVPLLKKTPEERKAIAQKAVATRAANRKARDDARQDALKHAGLNGNDRSGAKVAPIALDVLTGEDMTAIGL